MERGLLMALPPSGVMGISNCDTCTCPMCLVLNTAGASVQSIQQSRAGSVMKASRGQLGYDLQFCSCPLRHVSCGPLFPHKALWGLWMTHCACVHIATTTHNPLLPYLPSFHFHSHPSTYEKPVFLRWVGCCMNFSKICNFCGCCWHGCQRITINMAVIVWR